MPTITDSTVVASAYDTSGNGGRKLVRLSNGWLVAGVKDNVVPVGLVLYKSTDNGNTWASLGKYSSASTTVSDFSLVGNGNIVNVVVGITTGSLYYTKFDITTRATQDIGLNTLNTLDAQTSLGNCSLAYNASDNTLHASWASKNSTYPNSFNIRYAKGTINGDGSVTWGAVDQVTSANTAAAYITNPSIIIRADGQPIIFTSYYDGTSLYKIVAYSKGNIGSTSGDFVQASGYYFKDVYSVATYAQSNPSAIFVPTSINGLTNGRIWVAWNGLSATNATYNGIFASYSDDGGVTWSALATLATNAGFHLRYPSLTASKSGEINVLYSNGSGFLNRVVYSAGAWGAQTSVKSLSGATDCFPSALYDPTLAFTSPLVIYKDTAKVGFYGTWTVTTISVAQGSIGSISDKTNLLTYSITTDGTMSTITESVNGTVTNTRSATSGQSLIAGLTQAQWDAIKYGQYKNATGGLNTLTVSMGTDTWTYTFDKRLATTDDIAHAIQATQDTQSTFLPSMKSQLASAITAKGGTSLATDTFSTMISAINAFQGSGYTGGKRWATGTATSTATTDNTFTVSGLAFRPRVICWELASNGSAVGLYNSDMQNTSYLGFGNLSSANNSNYVAKSQATITNSGFTMRTNWGSAVATNFNWWAFE